MAGLNKAEAKQLLTVGGRTKFSDEVKDEALRHLIAKGCTIAEAADKFGMSVQTLSTYRKQQLEAHGLVAAAE